MPSDNLREFRCCNCNCNFDELLKIKVLSVISEYLIGHMRKVSARDVLGSKECLSQEPQKPREPREEYLKTVKGCSLQP